MVEAPTIDELYQIMNLAGTANQGLKTFPVAGLTAPLKKMAVWLYELAAIDADPCAGIKLCVETAEKAGPFEGMLSISTSHVSKETADLLGEGGDMPFPYYEHSDHGWLIYVNPDETPEDVSLGLPVELALLMLHARQCGCCWLLLDADATVLPEAPTFDW